MNNHTPNIYELQSQPDKRVFDFELVIKDLKSTKSCIECIDHFDIIERLKEGLKNHLEMCKFVLCPYHIEERLKLDEKINEGLASDEVKSEEQLVVE